VSTVSAIIPVYNPLQHLDKVLDSLAGQTELPDELIVTDDCSEEDVLGALRARRTRFPAPITYVRQPRRAPRRARCRNNGIRLARGEYLLFCDQDILFPRGYVETFRRERTPRRFLVAYPIRLTEAQTARVTPELIRTSDFLSLLNPAQRRKVGSSYRKEWWTSRLRSAFPILGYRPKLRSGVFGVHREPLERVNGFDETYEGWGNEDDDLGRRLYRAGILGRNVFRTEFPLHLHHPMTESRADRANLEYYHRRRGEIARGSIVAPRGLRDPLSDEPLEVVRLD